MRRAVCLSTWVYNTADYKYEMKVLYYNDGRAETTLHVIAKSYRGLFGKQSFSVIDVDGDQLFDYLDIDEYKGKSSAFQIKNHRITKLPNSTGKFSYSISQINIFLRHAEIAVAVTPKSGMLVRRTFF